MPHNSLHERSDMFQKLFAAVALTSGLVLTMPVMASADTLYLDEATQALQSSPVYVSPQVNSLSADQQASLVSEIGGNDIAIVVLPANASSEIEDIPSFLSELASRTGYDTILVSVDGDFEAGSSDLPSGSASRIANDAEGGDLYVGLSEFVAEVGNTSQSTPDQPSAEEGADLSGLFIGGGAVIGITLVVTLGTLFVRRRFTRPVRRQKEYTPELLQGVMKDILELADGIDDRNVAQTIKETAVHVNQLFARLRKRVPDKIQQVTAQYEGVLETVRKVTDRFADIEQHPQYFKQSDTLLRDGRRAIEQYKTGVIQNIQEIEEGSLTDFRVDTKILDAMVKEETPDYLNIAPPPTKKRDR